jgi:tetratricopeptide (TPR) repeat protein
VALLKSGGNADRMQNDLQRLARIMPVDPEANIFLARAYLDKHDYASAIKPVAIGLMTQHDAFTRNESLLQARILAHRANADLIVKSINDVLLQPWWKKPNRIQLCFDMANELAEARHFNQAISLLALAAPHCSGDQKAMALLKIGEYLAASFKYSEAFSVLTSAIMDAKDEALAQRIVAFRERIARLRDNTEHDVAQKIKIAILRKSGKLR